MCSFCGARSLSEGFVGQSWLTFRQALEPRRQRPQGRARHDRRLCRSLHAGGRTPAGRTRRRRARRHPVPQAVHGVQHGSMRGPARRSWSTAPPPVPEGLILPQAEALDRRDRRRFPHRRRPRFLQPGARLRPSAAARRLFRADQLAPDGPARARSLESDIPRGWPAIYRAPSAPTSTPRKSSSPK